MHSRESTAPRPTLLAAALIVAALLLSVLFRLPPMLAPGQTMRWTDAFFLSVSTLTLTGLTTRPIAAQLSPSGLALIAIAVEFAAIAWTVLGTHTLGRLIDPSPPPIARTLRRVSMTLLALQLVAAVAVCVLWRGKLTGAACVGAAVFHTIMASCHAGFAALPTAMGDMRHDPAVHVVLLPLMLVTSLGWPLGSVACRAIVARVRGRAHPPLTREANATLVALAVAYLAGVTLLLLPLAAPYFYESLKLGMEGKRELDGPLNVPRMGALLSDASLLCVGSRSGAPIGWSMDRVPTAARAAMIGLAFAGAGPAGPASGLGLTLAAVLVVAAARGARRRGPRAALVRRALGVSLWLMLTFASGLYLLCLSEPYPLTTLALEAASAAGNSHIATGIAGDMTLMGRITLMTLMVLGRLTLFVAPWSGTSASPQR